MGEARPSIPIERIESKQDKDKAKDILFSVRMMLDKWHAQRWN